LPFEFQLHRLRCDEQDCCTYIGQRYSEVWPTIHVPGDCCSIVKSPWPIVEAAVFELQIYLMLFPTEDNG